MNDDIEITISAEEPPIEGTNVTIRYSKGIRTGIFSRRSVVEVLDELSVRLQQAQSSSESLQAYGSRLFEALFSGSILDALRESLSLAHMANQSVRLRLISEIPSIIAIPWEYLYDARHGYWLALHADISLVRSLPLGTRTPLPVTDTLKVFVMLANPSDLPPLDSVQQWQQMEDATAIAPIKLTQIDPTYDALLAALRQSPHIFHYIGHGEFHDASNQGYLSLVGEDGQAMPISGDQLAIALGACKTLRMVILDTCQSAMTGTSSAFAGIAQRLLKQELPAVLAMQGEIFDDLALQFSGEFYQAIADGFGVEKAINEGRKLLYTVTSTWGIPSLYYQGVEPFVIAPLSNTAKADQLWQNAQALGKVARRRLLNTIIQLNPLHTDAQKALRWLDNEVNAEILYAAAETNYQNHQWREAHRVLEQVERLSPNFRETRSLLAEVLGKLEGLPLTPPPDYNAQVKQYEIILNALKDGRLVPFLGWGVSRFGRPSQDHWVKGLYLPSTDELASALAAQLHGTMEGKPSLLEVSQVTALLEGESALYERLLEFYTTSYPPTMLHCLLAELPFRLRKKGYPTNLDRRYIVFSTTFDDLLEDAFQSVGQPYHLFAYRQRTTNNDGVIFSGRFVHIPPDGEAIELKTPNTYTGHDLDRYPIIVKLCGRRVSTEPLDNVVITEDQFLDYMPAQEIGALLPMTLLNQVKRRNFLFFGHSLQPWYFRLLWQRLKYQKSPLHEKAWAIVPMLSVIEQAFWRNQGIEPLVASPEGLVAYVNRWLDKL